MAIQRKAVYTITVNGAVRAAKEIGELDTAAAGSAGALRSSGAAARDAASDYAQAEARAASLGARFDKLNDEANRVGGRFGDMRSRLGDLEDAFAVFSGVAVVQVGQAIAEMVTTVYGWTEAGKAARRETEGLTTAVQELSASFGDTFAAIDAEALLRLTAAMGKTNAASAEYQERLGELAGGHDDLAAMLVKVEGRIREMAIAGETTTPAWRHQVKLAEGLRISMADVAGQVERLQGSYLGLKSKSEAMRREQEQAHASMHQLTQASIAQAKALPSVIGQWVDYQLAVARGRTTSADLVDNIIGWHAKLAVVAIDAAEGIQKTIEGHKAGATDAAAHAAAVARLNDQLARLAGPDLDNLPAFNLDEIIQGGGGFDAAALTNDLLGPIEGSAEDMADRMATAYIASGQRVRDIIEANARDLAEGIADLTQGSIDVIERFVDGDVPSELDDIRALLEVSESAYGSWDTWASTATGAIESVQSALGSISMALSAIADAELVPLRNAETRANELLAIAEAAERAAEAEVDRARDTAGAAAADARLATASKERASAEREVYESRLAVIEAEERSAEVMQALRAVEFALEGAKMAAKSLEAGATASLLFAGGFFPQAAAATAAAVTYGLATAAYGVAATVTATTPTARQQRPAAPEDRATAARTVSAGDRDRGRDDRPNVYVEFSGGALHTKTEVQDTVVRAADLAGRRRGGARADYRRSSRRGGM